MTTKLKDFLFLDDETGEYFLVEVSSMDEAEKTASSYFRKPRFLEEMEVWEGEMMGLDTY